MEIMSEMLIRNKWKQWNVLFWERILSDRFDRRIRKYVSNLLCYSWTPVEGSRSVDGLCTINIEKMLPDTVINAEPEKKLAFHIHHKKFDLNSGTNRGGQSCEACDRAGAGPCWISSAQGEEGKDRQQSGQFR